MPYEARTGSDHQAHAHCQDQMSGRGLQVLEIRRQSPVCTFQSAYPKYDDKAVGKVI